MISASKVELAAKCPAAFVLPHTEEKRASTEAGTSRHADLEAQIKRGDIPDVLEGQWPGYSWESEVAMSIDLATGEGRVLGAGIGRAYGDVGVMAIVGTADLVGRGPAGELVICDRKSFDPNISRAAVNGQLHTLAAMACRAYGVTSCEVAIWHELRPLDVAPVEPWDLVQYEKDLRLLLSETARARADYRRTGLVSATPGQHCRWCPAHAACPATSALMTRVASGTIGASIEAVSLDDDSEAARFYALSKDLGMLLKRMRERLDARAAEKPIPISDGIVYGKRPIKGSRVIDADQAYAMIRESHGQSVADAAVTREASQTGILAAFKAAGIAGAAAEKDKLVRALDAAGGVTRKDSWKIDEHPALALESGEQA